jgi:hypothetical protein
MEEVKFAEAMARLHEIRFFNLVVDAGTVHSLPTIARLLTNQDYPIQLIVVALREKTNFSVDDCMALLLSLFISRAVSNCDHRQFVH